MVATIDELSNRTFDYVIVGGGTSGLTVAARLAEDPNVTVAVLEAGLHIVNDALIDLPSQYGYHLGNPKYDWAFMTTPQKHSNDKTYLWSRGRMLGGSSGINYLFWGKPPAQDIDAWESLGNPGWNWERFAEYSKKSEGFTPPTDGNKDLYKQLFVPTSHGHNGPLQTSFPGLVSDGDLRFQETIHNKGIQTAKDPLGGDPVGTFMAVMSVDPKTHTRSSAATAYYLPNKDKSNFYVLCNAVAHRLLTSGGDGDLVAEGVEFEFQGQKHVVHARKEVVLSAGALKTPQLLELSGIGDLTVLEPLGIQTKINLPGVGANAQEHMFCVAIFELKSGVVIETWDGLRNPAIAAENQILHPEGKGLYNVGMGSYTFVPLKAVTDDSVAEGMIAKQRKRVEERAASLPPGLKEQFDLQMKDLESGRGVDCEVICLPACLSAEGPPDTSKSYMSICPALNHPFSRGTVHIVSNDPNAQPSMDPHYFEEEFDLRVFVEMLNFVRRLPETEPFKGMVGKEIKPGPECVTEEDVKDFIKNTISTTFHTVGTASMLPRAKNGVVDSNLRVYGTKNIRVVDLSIIPLHIAAHTQAAAYAVAEQAADLIKGKL